MLAPSLKKKLILSLSHRSPSCHLRQWAVVMQRDTSKMSSVKSQTQSSYVRTFYEEQAEKVKLLCSHLLWRTGLKGEALMFAPSMKNRLQRWSSYVRTLLLKNRLKRWSSYRSHLLWGRSLFECLSRRSPSSHLTQWAVAMQRDTSKMSSVKSQLSSTELLCSHLLWRTGFAPSMKKVQA